MQDIDVIILGAGTSGSTVALLLARKGYRVVLISRDIGTQHHLPESWIYNLPKELQDLGLEKKLFSSMQLESRCSFSSSDDQYSIEIAVKDKRGQLQQGDLAWIDRNRFDQTLLQTALEHGVMFYPLSSILSCEITSDGVTLHTQNQGKTLTLTSSYIIDATGKSAFLSNHLNLPIEEKKLDPRIAYFSHFELESEELKEMKILYTPSGYLFCFPLSKQRVSIGCVLAENTVNINTSLEEIFTEAISTSSYLTALISKAKKVLPVIPAKNIQRICLEPAGSRYRLIGDAAAFLDPFFCPGIDFAFFSAEKAVESIVRSSPLEYKTQLFEWLRNSQNNVYQKMEQSHWHAIIRLFADPHLPFVIPLILTQSFMQLTGTKHSLQEGIQLARSAYEMAPC